VITLDGQFFSMAGGGGLKGWQAGECGLPAACQVWGKGYWTMRRNAIGGAAVIALGVAIYLIGTAGDPDPPLACFTPAVPIRRLDPSKGPLP